MSNILRHTGQTVPARQHGLLPGPPARARPGEGHRRDGKGGKRVQGREEEGGGGGGGGGGAGHVGRAENVDQFQPGEKQNSCTSQRSLFLHTTAIAVLAVVHGDESEFF